MASAVILAAAGAIGTAIGAKVIDNVGTSVHVYAYEDESAVANYSFATERAYDPASTARVAADGTGAASAVKTAVEGVKLTVQPGNAKHISVLDMKATIISKSRPTTGTLFFSTTQGTPNARIGIDLAAVSPVARQLPGNIEIRAQDEHAPLGAPYFNETHDIVSDDEAPVFEIRAFPGPYTYRWRIDMTLLINGHPEHFPVYNRDNHTPFTLTGFSRHYSYVYQLNDNHRWQRATLRSICGGRPACDHDWDL